MEVGRGVAQLITRELAVFVAAGASDEAIMTDVPVLAVRRCESNPLEREHSLCGDAPEAFELGMAPEPFEPAGKRSITCRRCCEAIREVKAIRNRLEPQGA